MPRASAVPAAERRAHAVQALLDLARHTAPDQISTAAIAERMGVSHGALFRHFPSRDALWAEAVRWATNALEIRFEACSEPTPLGQIQALLDGHATMLAQHPGLVRMLFAELQRPAPSAAREIGMAFMQRFRGRLTTLLTTAQTDASMDPRLDPRDWASLLVATQQGLVLQALAHDGFADLAECSQRTITLLLRTVTAPGATPGE